MLSSKAIEEMCEKCCGRAQKVRVVIRGKQAQRFPGICLIEKGEGVKV